MTAAMPANKFDEMFHRFHCGGALDRGDQMAILNEANRARDQAAILEDELKKVRGAVESARAIQLRQHDGRALRLACNIISEALAEDVGLSVWHGVFKELGIDHMRLYDMDPGERSWSLSVSFREAARKESEVRVAGQVCSNCGGHRMGAEPIECCPACNTPYETDEGKKETMSEESEEKKFKAGEIVRLNSGGPMMTIGTPSEASSSCYWFDGVKPKSWGFPTAALRAVDADEIDAERTVLFAEADKVKANAERLKLLFEELQTKVIPKVVEYLPSAAEYIREKTAAERLKGEPLQLANAFKEAFLGLNDEQRKILLDGVFALAGWSDDPAEQPKFMQRLEEKGRRDVQAVDTILEHTIAEHRRLSAEVEAVLSPKRPKPGGSGRIKGGG